MVYIFDALSHNRLLKPGDQIAIATPIFTPYMQIPSVKDYGLVSIDVSSTEESHWEIDEAELAKLEDPSVKAFFLVNPSNPASHALSEMTLARLEAGGGEEPGPDHPDRRRVRHLRGGLPVGLRGAALQHHPGLFLLQAVRGHRMADRPDRHE